MLKKVGFTNFKSWSKVEDLELGKIAGFFGTNSSGKTSILQSILLMKQTIESSDRALVLNFGDDKSLVNLGTFKDAVKNHDVSSPLTFKFSWKLQEKIDVLGLEGGKKSKPVLSGDAIDFNVDLREEGSRLIVQSMSYGFSETRFTFQRKPDKKEYFLESENNSYQFIRSRGRAWALPGPVKSYGFPDRVKAYFQNAEFLADLELAFEECFSQTYYLGPLRENPKRQYLWSGADPTDMGRKGEKVVDALLAARDKALKIKQGHGKKAIGLEEYVAIWLKKLGLIHSFNVEAVSKGNEIFRVWVQKFPDSPKVLITDVGFGVSQVLPVLVLCFYVPEGSTIVLEQPEIHLHPSVQSGLADLFIDAIEKRNIQILFESHSEHLLRRLQRRIAEQKISSDNVSLYFCDAKEEGSSVNKLQVDLFGSILNWPKDFFGNEFEEMASITQAVLKRKSEQHTS